MNFELRGSGFMRLFELYEKSRFSQWQYFLSHELKSGTRIDKCCMTYDEFFSCT